MEIVNGLQYFFKYYLNTQYLKTCHGKHGKQGSEYSPLFIYLLHWNINK